MTEDGDQRDWTYPYRVLKLEEIAHLYHEEVTDAMLHYDAAVDLGYPNTYIFKGADVRVRVYEKTVSGLLSYYFKVTYPDGRTATYRTLDSVVRVQAFKGAAGQGPWLDAIGEIMSACSKLQFYGSLQRPLPCMYADTEWEADLRAAMRPNGIIPWKAGPEEFYLECEAHACHGALPHELPREGHFDVLSYIHVKRGCDPTLYGLREDQKWDSNLVAGENHLESLVGYVSAWAKS
jgi:hypothetical protein